VLFGLDKADGFTLVTQIGVIKPDYDSRPKAFEPALVTENKK
jgi:hypothetical protein